MSKRPPERRQDNEEGPIKKRRNEGPVPPMFKVFHCEVASVKEYGIFVKIPGTDRQGLVHKSQISKSRVDDPSDMFARGEYVYCKVISIQEDGDKIGLAMKSVNQTTGQDQDPNNIELSQDEQRRKQFGNRPGREKIVLDAVLDTTCKKCGGTGHLAQDCFKTGDASYELIPDLDDYMHEVGTSNVHKKDTESSPKKKSKKNKKEKKKKEKKRKKKTKRYSSSSSSSDSSSDDDVRHRKKKHHKERRDRKREKERRERRHSSSSSG
ncbi:zinc finger CCHC domain-containing protein 17-like [Mya arenaria]|uniref:zinc finger CCHC domain-containing protein 17-like n=1 Tax=Mya arenaria TaxID=6604 RepID=UPI0022E0EF26|nr:zinc finger CCHC domain-containing protein 17-like [Mya arenaria]